MRSYFSLNGVQFLPTVCPRVCNSSLTAHSVRVHISTANSWASTIGTVLYVWFEACLQGGGGGGGGNKLSETPHTLSWFQYTEFNLNPKYVAFEKYNGKKNALKPPFPPPEKQTNKTRGTSSRVCQQEIRTRL